MTGNLASSRLLYVSPPFLFPMPPSTNPKPTHLVNQQQEMKPIMQVASAAYHANKRLRILSLHKQPRLVIFSRVCVKWRSLNAYIHMYAKSQCHTLHDGSLVCAVLRLLRESIAHRATKNGDQKNKNVVKNVNVANNSNTI